MASSGRSLAFAFLSCIAIAPEGALLRQRAAASGNPLEKVGQMLLEMKGRSKEIQQEEAEAHNEEQKTCEQTKKTNMAEIRTLDFEIGTLLTNIAEAEAAARDMSWQMSSSNRSVGSASKLLSILRYNHTVQAVRYATDLREYALAINSVSHAIELLSQEQMEAPSFLEKWSVGMRNFEQNVRSARRLKGYTPFEMTVDEAMFDDLTGPKPVRKKEPAAPAAPSPRMVDVLEQLQTIFQSARDTLIKPQQESRDMFSSLEQSLLEQIRGSADEQATSKSFVEDWQGFLSLMRDQLAGARSHQERAAAFSQTAEMICEAKDRNFDRMKEMRGNEMHALEQASEVISGSPSASLLRTVSMVKRGSQRLASPHDATGKVLQFLHAESRRLSSDQIGELVSHLGSVAPGIDQDEDVPLDKVKLAVQELVTKLEQQVAEQADQKAFCDGALAKREEAAISTRAADVERRYAMRARLRGDAALLEEQVAQLNMTIEEASRTRERLSEERKREQDANTATIEEATTSAAAVEAALTVLRAFYSGVSSGFQLVPMPHKLPQIEASRPLEADDPEGSAILHKLEALRDNYRSIQAEASQSETDAQRAQTQSLGQHDAMLVAMTADRDLKMTENARFRVRLPKADAGLNTSGGTLTDVHFTSAFCSGQDTYGARLSQRQAELESLQESTRMMEEMSADSQGTTLAQMERSHKVRVESRRLGLVVDGGAARDADDLSFDGPGDITEVVALLRHISEEIEDDLADDKRVSDEMQCWCQTTIAEKTAEATEAGDRENELETQIESSMRETELLGSQIGHSENELGEQQTKLQEAARIREREHTEFYTNERGLVTSIASLKNAVKVLEERYNGDKESLVTLKGRQTRTKTTNKPIVEAALVVAANDLTRAFKTMPGSMMATALGSSQDTAVIQGFLAAPRDVLLLPWKRSSLAETSALSHEPGASGQQIFGILNGMLATFEEDLASSRRREMQAKAEYESVYTSKQTTIETTGASIDVRQSQLDHHTIVNAEAKEDLANIEASSSADQEYLLSIQQQCADSKHEFEEREADRNDELTALSQAIGVITASGSAADAAALSGASFLQPTSSAVNRTDLGEDRHLMAAAPPALRPPVQTTSFVASGRRPRRLGLRVGRLEPVAVHAHPSWHGQLSALSTSSVARPAQKSSGKTGGRAFADVLNQTDSMRSNLLAEKQQEIDMKETCITEANEGAVQKERRLADQLNLHTTIQRVEVRINDLTGQIDRVTDGIDALNQSLTTAHGERVEQFHEFQKAVNDQESHQKSLRRAIQVLKHFHSTGTIALLHVAHGGSAPNQENSYWAEVDLESDGKDSLKQEATPLSSANKWAKMENGWADVHDPESNQPRGFSALPQVLRSSAPDEENSYWAEVDQQDGGSASAEQQPLAPASESKWAKMENVLGDVDLPGTRSPQRSGGVRRGVLNIIALLMDKSEAMIEAIVQAEEKARKAYSIDLTFARVSIEEKDRELITLEAARGDASAQLSEAQIALEGVNTDIHELAEFLSIVDRCCSDLLSNFGKSQETRAAEIGEIARAKQELRAAQSDLATRGQASTGIAPPRSGL